MSDSAYTILIAEDDDSIRHALTDVLTASGYEVLALEEGLAAIQEGMVWEAAMAASHHNLKNLVAIVDCNGVQINGWVNDIMTVEPLGDKWRSFGWRVVEVNGHNMKDILTALHTAKTMRCPTVILMRTVKGKGVSFMEDDSSWHGAAPDDEQLVKAIAEIEEGGVV